MIKKILFATDLGLYGPYVMRQVSLLAQSSGAQVDVVHAVKPMGLFAESIIDCYMPDKDKQYLRRQGVSEVVEKIRLQVRDTLNSEYADTMNLLNLGDVVVEVGHPAQIILEQAALRQSDLIVIGGHDHNGQNAPLGSIVSKVLQLSHVPVYVVPMINIESLSRS